MNKIIMTMPIKPQKTTNIGMYIAPTVMSVLSDVLPCTSTMSINTLNTYKDKSNDLLVFINDLKRQGIRYDNLFIDQDNAIALLTLIEQLLYKGVIKESIEEVFRCDCGKVDILKEGINASTSKLYYQQGIDYYCKECGSLCKSYKEAVLTLPLVENIDDSLTIVPTFLKGDANNLSKQFKGSKLLISKQRNTGYQISTLNKTFNIDVDFIWTNYFNLFECEQIIMLASNHQLYQMYILNYLNGIVSGTPICFIANPYMNNSSTNILEQYEKTQNDIYKKLFILYNLKWRNKNCDWSSSVIEYLSTISTTRRNNLYEVIRNCRTKFNEDAKIDVYLESILTRGINMQINIEESKRLVKTK